MGKYSSDSSGSSNVDRRKSKKSSQSRRRRSRSSSHERGSRGSSSSNRKRRRSRSNSSSRSPRVYRSSRRSRSRSRESSRNKARSRSRERSRQNKGRSRSRSRERSKNQSKSSKSRHHDRSRERSRSKERLKISDSVNPDVSLLLLQTAEEKLQIQLKQALEAAANADAKLQEQGFLSHAASSARNKLEKLQIESKATSITDQLKRSQAIDEVNDAGFKQQAFVSSKSGNKQGRQSSASNVVQSISELTLPESSQSYRVPADAIAHENLYGNEAVRQEKWIKKLMALRQRKINIYYAEQRMF